MIKGSSHSKESRRRMSEAHRGRVVSEETRKKISKAGRGRKLGPKSEEHRKKLSDALSGRENQFSEEHIQNIVIAGRNRRGRRSNGDPSQGEYITSEGYRKLTGQWDHPRVRGDGTVHEHEKILYDMIGPGPHLCYWKCGRLLSWDGGPKLGIVVDHLDNDRLNNDPNNLVPSCRFENQARTQWWWETWDGVIKSDGMKSGC